MTKAKNKDRTEQTLYNLFQLHRYQAVLHNVELAVDRIGDSRITIKNIPTEKGFFVEREIAQAAKHLTESTRLLLTARDTLARSVHSIEQEIGEAVGWLHVAGSEKDK